MAAIPVNDDQEFTLETRDVSPAHFLVKIESLSLLSNHGIQKYESTEFAAGGYKWCSRVRCSNFQLDLKPALDIVSRHEDFSAGGCNWKIQLYPNGNGVQRGKSVSIFLKLVSRPLQKKVNADYCIRIQNQNRNGSVSHKSSCWFTSSSPSSAWGWDGFVSLADIRDPMKGLVVNGRCVLEVDISVGAIVKA